MKVVINKCYGGFHLSVEAVKRLYVLKDPHLEVMSIKKYYGIYNKSTRDINIKYKYCDKNGKLDMKKVNEDAKWMGRLIIGDNYIFDEHHWGHKSEIRACPLLIKVIEELGDKANHSSVSNLKIVTIPDAIEWEIGEYDGIEWIDEKHRSWG